MFIGGAGGAAALAAGGSLVLVRSGGSGPTAAPVATATSGAGLSPDAGPSSTAVAPKHGGVATITAPSSFHFDTFDAQLSGSSSVVEVLGRTHSRLLNWDSKGPTLLPDLAVQWETPDATTLVCHLDAAAKWQDRAPLNGRDLTAEDVVAHFRRSLDIAAGGKASPAQRYHDYSALDSVDSPAAGQVRFRLKRPDQFFLGTLAGEYALVQAPEAVAAFSGQWRRLDSDHVIGTGPWTFDWADNGAKFAAFREGHRKPLLDELRVWEPRENVVRFLNSEAHEIITRDRREADAIRAKLPIAPTTSGELREVQRAIAAGQVYENQRFEREIVLSSFSVGSAPWSQPALISAISAALNRYELAMRLFGGRARPSPPVPPALTPGNISAEQLRFTGGYARLEGSYAPSPEVRQRWDAVGGPGLGPVTVDFPSVFDPLYSASSIVIDMLNGALGPQFRPAVETYATISKRVLDGYYGNGRAAFWFGWAPPLPGPESGRYMAETYAPGSPGQRATGGAGLASSDATVLFEQGFLGIVPWVQQHAEVFRRPSHIAPAASPFWSQHLDYQRSNL